MNKRTIGNRLGFVLLCIWFPGIACVDNGIFDRIDQPCFTKESLETVPWIVDELKDYTLPNGGGYHAAVYLYHDQQFLAITTPFGCTPLGHIFNCAGVPLDSLGIDYNDFGNNRRLAAILTEPR
nr:hypothetical protein [uncultured Dyadobacter sp.]